VCLDYGAAAERGITLSRSVAYSLAATRIVPVLLLDVGRQLSELQFHNAAVEVDHNPIRFDPAHLGVFVFFAVDRFEVVGQRGETKITSGAAAVLANADVTAKIARKANNTRSTRSCLYQCVLSGKRFFE
jgi:hypothetical protein